MIALQEVQKSIYPNQPDIGPIVIEENEEIPRYHVTQKEELKPKPTETVIRRELKQVPSNTVDLEKTAVEPTKVTRFP